MEKKHQKECVWEKALYELPLIGHDVWEDSSDYCTIRDFIKNLLLSERKRMVEGVELKKESAKNIMGLAGSFYSGYTSALSDVIRLIEGK